MFVDVESLHEILHCLILLLILHNIRGRQPLHSMSISVGYSLPRSHFALVVFFVFVHDGVGIGVSGCATSIGGPPIGIEVSMWRIRTDLDIGGPPIPVLSV